MKNIYVLPTDKPSRLQSNKYSKLFLSEVPKAYADCINQNIYITSDEEIKDGDWFLLLSEEIVLKSDNNSLKNRQDLVKKIILTTDQKLINDDVQAIPDEFLKWFIKNPSCEEIEVDWVDFSQSYFIKIPKEESKQETLEEDLEEIKNIRIWLKDRKQRFIKQLKNK